MFLQLFHKKPVRDLCQDPDSVSGFSFCILAGPMLQVLHDRKGVIHQTMALAAFHIDNGADPAVIMLEGRIIKPLLLYLFKQIFHSDTSVFTVLTVLPDSFLPPFF